MQKSAQLKLIYEPKETKYYRDIDMVSIDKTEIDKKSKMLLCKLKMAALTDYYTKQTYSFAIGSENEFRWSFRWPVRMQEYGKRSILFNNIGHEPAEVQVTIRGYIKNSVMKLYQDNILTKTMPFNVTIEQGEYLFYSNVEGAEKFELHKEDGTVVNEMQSLDITADNFFKIPVGNSVITITAENQAIDKLQVAFITTKIGV